MQYVGETQQTLNARFRLHESMINTKKENPVADHFNEEDHIENRLDFKNKCSRPRIKQEQMTEIGRSLDVITQHPSP